jgi:hypothetical protein
MVVGVEWGLAAVMRAGWQAERWEDPVQNNERE